MSRTRLLVVVCLLVAGAACAPGPSEDGPPDPGDPAAGALEALPACPTPPAPATSPPIPGLELPEGSVVTTVQDQDPVTTVMAFTPFTPVQFEAGYKDRDGITVLLTENEIYEAELLISNGTHRNFLKATATCATGSQVLAVVAPEVDAEGLPLPQGAATPSASPSG